MPWTDETGAWHPSAGDTVTAAGVEHLYTCPRCKEGQPKPQPAESVTSATSGSDWRDVEEGTEYTAEQAARRFLDSTWDEQVAMAGKALDNAGDALACRILNHEGAHIFATQHSCQKRYDEGFEAGKQAVVEHMERLADEQFGPKEDINGG